MADYPCTCDSMMWIIDNTKLIVKQDGKWVAVWIELDKTSTIKTNVCNYGVQFDYCLFCGKEIFKGY